MIEAEILLPLPCSIFHCLWVSTSIHLHPVLDSVLQPSDPVLVDLDELARRAPHSAAHRFNSALRKAAVAAVLQKGCAHPQSLARHSLKRRHACTTEQRTAVRLWGCAFVAFWFSFRTCPKIPPEREKGMSSLLFTIEHRLSRVRVEQDPGTKRYKFPQLFNDFSLSLTKAVAVASTRKPSTAHTHMYIDIDISI